MTGQQDTGTNPLLLEAASLEAELGKQTEQAKTLRNAREKLGVTTEELAELLGVEVPTLNSWLLPTTSKAHRPMNRTAKLLLARILADQRRKS